VCESQADQSCQEIELRQVEGCFASLRDTRVLESEMEVLWNVDYTAFVSGAEGQDVGRYLAQELPFAWRDSYLTMGKRPLNIVRFQCRTFEYLYDDTASLGVAGVAVSDSGFEARLVAVSGRSCPRDTKRDDARLRGWVGATEKTFGKIWDKGHFIGHSIGGAVDGTEVNVFVQRRDVNRGWSVQGKQYREMEKHCQLHPGTFCFSRPIYLDQTARPALVEYGLLRNDAELWVECFENR
jgi:hypothetical protein